MIADFLLFSASNDNFSSLRLQIYLSITAAVAAIVVGVRNIILVWRVCLLQEEFESNRKKSRRRRRQLRAYKQAEKNRVPVTAISSNEMKHFSMKRRQNSESVKWYRKNICADDDSDSRSFCCIEILLAPCKKKGNCK